MHTLVAARRAGFELMDRSPTATSCFGGDGVAGLRRRGDHRAARRTGSRAGSRHLARLVQRPPALAARLDLHDSRCHDALEPPARFGVHILRADESTWRRVRRPQGEDKFAGAGLALGRGVPELSGALAYLRCRRAETLSPLRPHDPDRRPRARAHRAGRAAGLRAPPHGLAAQPMTDRLVTNRAQSDRTDVTSAPP